MGLSHSCVYVLNIHCKNINTSIQGNFVCQVFFLGNMVCSSTASERLRNSGKDSIGLGLPTQVVFLGKKQPSVVGYCQNLISPCHMTAGKNRPDLLEVLSTLV